MYRSSRPKADIRKRHVVKINMIKEFYKAIDEDSEMSLIRAQELLDSDQLLTGLGKYYSKCTIPESVNVVTEFERADYLMNSREMPFNPTEGEQYFSDILTGAVSGNGYSRYPRAEGQQRKFAARPNNSNNLDEYIRGIIEESYERNGVRDALFDHFNNVNPEGINRHLDTHYPSIIYMIITACVRAGYYGGMDTWPISKQLSNSLEIGGVPTGWVGALPDLGGQPELCVQIIHFGPMLSN